MQLQHSSDKPLDLPTQMNMLSRTMTNMFLKTICCADPLSHELYTGVMSTISNDWNDATHHINTEFIPGAHRSGLPDHTRVEITVENTYADDPRQTITLVLSVLLGHMRTEYHTRYIPVSWDLDATKTVIDKFSHAITYDLTEFQIAGGVGLAILRTLVIQLGATLEIESNPLISPDVIDKFRTYGMPEASEMMFLRCGIDHLMHLIKDAQPSD